MHYVGASISIYVFFYIRREKESSLAKMFPDGIIRAGTRKSWLQGQASDLSRIVAAWLRGHVGPIKLVSDCSARQWVSAKHPVIFSVIYAHAPQEISRGPGHIAVGSGLLLRGGPQGLDLLPQLPHVLSHLIVYENLLLVGQGKASDGGVQLLVCQGKALDGVALLLDNGVLLPDGCSLLLSCLYQALDIIHSTVVLKEEVM